MAGSTADQTRGMFNDSDKTFQEEQETPITNEGDGAISQQRYNGMHVDDEFEDTTFITVTGKRIKRFRTTIRCIHVPGDNLSQKLDAIYSRIANAEGFLECKPFFDKRKREAWITAIFNTQEAAENICKLTLFENNDFTFTLLQNRGDDEVLQRSLVVRDLPLDVNRNLLKTILENKFGKIEALRMRIAGPWYRADITFEQAEGMQQHKELWSIQYKKDLCRIAPAYFTRDDIEQRHQYTAKLTNLPFGTTPVDLQEILRQVKAKTCFIPRTRTQYSRKRFAYISFESEEDLQNVMTHIRVVFNDNELYWEAENSKTCHKCGSSQHLVAKCSEKESAENFKEYRKQFTNIYSKYKVPNYRNAVRKPIMNHNQIKRSVNNEGGRQPAQPINNDLKTTMENLIKSLRKDIEEKFDKINNQLIDLNNRIKIIEVKTGLDKPKVQPKTTNRSKTFKFDMSYIATRKDLEKKNATDASAEESNKRPLAELDNSSGDDVIKNDKATTDKQKQPRKKIIKIADDDKDISNTNNKDNAEIKGIKDTQTRLESEVLDLKSMFTTFTNELSAQWNNAVSNVVNGSSSTSPIND
jgi:hypothetical protein